MVLIPGECPDCQRIDGSRSGTQPKGEQRYRCHHLDIEQEGAPLLALLKALEARGRLVE